MLRSSLMPVIFKSKLLILILAFVSLFIVFSSLYVVNQQTRTVSKAAIVVTPPPAKPFATTSGKPPQFVLLSFDGSLSLNMWQQTHDFSQQMKAAGKPLHFTYFISGVYFLAPQYSTLYHPPQAAPGTSPIHFADSINNIPLRIEALNRAYLDGHEIASHANGHFRGFPWTEQNWQQEFSEFNKLIFGWKNNNQITDNINLVFKQQDIVGFRAPLLSRNDYLYKVEAKNHFLYDSSGLATSRDTWPIKDPNGIWLIPLANIPLAGTKNEIIAMDYNFYDTQSGAHDLARRDTPLWQKYYQQTYDSYLNYFNHNYEGNRAPVLIGHHFSLWNDGVYWQVMQDFAQNVCGKPEVHCVSFKELVGYLNSKQN